MGLMSLTAMELGRKIQQKEVTAVEAVREALAQIGKMEPLFHCLVTVDEEGAIKRAKEVQKRI